MSERETNLNDSLKTFSRELEHVLFRLKVSNPMSSSLTSFQSSSNTNNSSNQIIGRNQNSNRNVNKFQSRGNERNPIPPTVGFMGVSNGNNRISTLRHRNESNNRSSNPQFQQVQRKCIYCNQTDHYPDQCKKYSTVETRTELLRSLTRNKRFCGLCLRTNHLTKDCNQQGKTFCVYCKGSHHRSLCFSTFRKPMNKYESGQLNVENTSENTIDNQVQVASESGQLAFIVTNGERKDNTVEKTYSGSVAIPMQYVHCYVQNKETKVKVKVNLLIDSGTKRSFIKQKVCENLGLTIKNYQELSVCTFTGSKPTVVVSGQVDLNLELGDGSFLNMTAHTAPNLSSAFRLDPVPLSENDRKLVSKYCTLEQVSEKPRNIELDMLLGQDYWPYIMIPNQKIVQLEKSGAFLIETKLGWLPSGVISSVVSVSNDCTTLALFVNDRSVEIEDDKYLNVETEKLWNLDAIGITDQETSSDDTKAQEIFDDNVTFQENRIWVCWPFKEKNPKLPDNYFQAYKRLQIMCRVLERNPEIHKKYATNFEDQLNKGIIEKIDEKVKDGPLVHYIPHQAVITPQKQTTKLRIVFDASAKMNKNSLSLNECLYRGPVLLSDLCGILLRFRLKAVVLLSDIEKAFLQIALYPKDREVTRFLWLKDPTKLTTKNNIQVFCFCRVPFGVITSPYLLAAAVRWLLNRYNTKVALQIKDKIYADNVITGTDTVQEAKEFYREAKSIFSEGSMNLSEWTSNSQEFVDSIPEVDRAKGETVKVLGVPWNLNDDELYISVSPKSAWENCSTRRQVLTCVASVFDPLGFMSCFTIPVKIFLQSLWKANLDWDTKFPPEKMKEWLNIISSVEQIRELKIRRFCQIGKNANLNLV